MGNINVTDLPQKLTPSALDDRILMLDSEDLDSAGNLRVKTQESRYFVGPQGEKGETGGRGPQGLSGDGSGDMLTAIYDPILGMKQVAFLDDLENLGNSKLDKAGGLRVDMTNNNTSALPYIGLDGKENLLGIGANDVGKSVIIGPSLEPVLDSSGVNIHGSDPLEVNGSQELIAFDLTLGNGKIDINSLGAYYRNMLIVDSFFGTYTNDVIISSNTNLSAPQTYRNLTINAGRTLSSTNKYLFIKVSDTLTINGTISMTGMGGKGALAQQTAVPEDINIYNHNLELTGTRAYNVLQDAPVEDLLIPNVFRKLSYGGGGQVSINGNSRNVGANGGGLIVIIAKNIVFGPNGKIESNGQNGFSAPNTNSYYSYFGQGGGGGGTILIFSKNNNGLKEQITANGGAGGNGAGITYNSGSYAQGVTSNFRPGFSYGTAGNQGLGTSGYLSTPGATFTSNNGTNGGAGYLNGIGTANGGIGGTGASVVSATAYYAVGGGGGGGGGGIVINRLIS